MRSSRFASGMKAGSRVWEPHTLPTPRTGPNSLRTLRTTGIRRKRPSSTSMRRTKCTGRTARCVGRKLTRADYAMVSALCAGTVLRLRQPNEGLLSYRHCYPRMEAGILHSAAGGSHALPGVRSGDPHAARLLVVLQGVPADLQQVLFNPWRMTMFRLKVLGVPRSRPDRA